MNYRTDKQEALTEAERQLGDCGGGSAMRLCIQGVELISKRGDVLDERYRVLVIEAVAEALCMPVQVGRYPAP